jgi:4-hydroxybenzoate polyprenyltransferase
MKHLGDLASILRLHIVLIAFSAALTFGWLFGGEYLWGVALLGAADWLWINLFNRLTDLPEDRANRIRGTDLVDRQRRAFGFGLAAIVVSSWAVALAVYPGLTLCRAILLFIGFAYSYPLIPTPSGRKRLKEIYFVKNFMSAVLFVITVCLYPLLTLTGPLLLPGGALAVVLLAAFFVAFELTYEILYDLRDLDGDRLAGIPTYPVVHGPVRARQIIDGLLLLSAGFLLAGFASGLLGLRETLMVFGPAAQLAFYRPRVRRGLTRADCVWLTHLGSGLLLLYLAGNRIWLWAGLPENIFL